MKSAKPKKRESTVVEDRKQKILDSIQPEGEGAGDVDQFWRDSIEKLESQEFETLDDAIGAIVDEALVRLGSEAPKGDEARKFLIDAFAFDEELQEEVRRVLQIRNS